MFPRMDEIWLCCLEDAASLGYQPQVQIGLLALGISSYTGAEGQGQNRPLLEAPGLLWGTWSVRERGQLLFHTIAFSNVMILVQIHTADYTEHIPSMDTA